MKTVRVRLANRSYPIVVGSELLTKAGKILSRQGFKGPPILISNPRVLNLHGEVLLRSLAKAFGRPAVILIGDGERYKRLATLQKVYDAMFRARADRQSWVVAFGGGVVGDLAGFAAATFMRGIPYVNLPTTLLAQVDSSIGGKVGINVPQGKNLVGVFHQPRAVLSDTRLLRTLPPRELASGLYEVIKCGAIRSTLLLDYIEKRLDDILRGNTAALEHIVLEASRIKAEVVSGDEKEDDLRMILNYGHTVGHALEAATDYRRFKHGEAVGWGMIAAARFGREVGLLSADEAERLASLILRVEVLPPLRGIPLPAVWNALKRDKKSRAGKTRMVLLSRLGRPEIRSDIDPVHLHQFLRRFLACPTEIAQGPRKHPGNANP